MGGLGGALWTPTLYRETGNPKDPPHRKGKKGVLRRGGTERSHPTKRGGSPKRPPPKCEMGAPPPHSKQELCDPPPKKMGVRGRCDKKGSNKAPPPNKMNPPPIENRDPVTPAPPLTLRTPPPTLGLYEGLGGVR